MFANTCRSCAQHQRLIISNRACSSSRTSTRAPSSSWEQIRWSASSTTVNWTLWSRQKTEWFLMFHLSWEKRNHNLNEKTETGLHCQGTRRTSCSLAILQGRVLGKWNTFPIPTIIVRVSLWREFMRPSENTSCIGCMRPHRLHEINAMSAGVPEGTPGTISTSSVRAGLHRCSCGTLSRTLHMVCDISVNGTCTLVDFYR
jgi:hypothetical protein